MNALIEAIAGAAADWRNPGHPRRRQSVERTLKADNRFTEQSIAFAINQQMEQLTINNLHNWVRDRCTPEALKVGVLNAGNIPMVGLQDYLAVLLTGHAYRGVVSSKSPALMPAFAASVERRVPWVDSEFVSVDQLWSAAEALLATGSDVTADWCRRKARRHGMPGDRCLVRGHRYSIAVLDGRENSDDCDRLAEDVMLHGGAGCRSVALIFAPRTLEPDRYLESLALCSTVFPPHPATSGALAMSQALLKAIDTPHAYGEGLEFLVSRGGPDVQGPGHVRWAVYDELEEAVAFIDQREDELQCVAARPHLHRRLPDCCMVVELGETQRPPLDWHPDGVDTVAFLAGLSGNLPRPEG
ncbi:MAG: hypothetical protein OXU68_12085 [Bacteroidota bacterium]|nr:hypothetical protein [Bacteroidota bacterium]